MIDFLDMHDNGDSKLGPQVTLLRIAVFALGAFVAGCSTRDSNHAVTTATGCWTGKWPGQAKPTISVFLVSGCPIAQSYAAELTSLQVHLATQLRDAVDLKIYLAEPGANNTTAQSLVARYGYPGPIIPDPAMTLTKQFGVSYSPEAVLTDDSGRVVYRGRIDDTWTALRRRREAPTKRSLRDALAAMVAGRTIEEATTPVVGCHLEVR